MLRLRGLGELRGGSGARMASGGTCLYRGDRDKRELGLWRPIEGEEWDLGRRLGPHFPLNEGRQLICHPASQDGIEPMWEDPRNKRGGRWLVSLAKQQRHIELDRLWLETVSWGLGGEGTQRKGQGWCGTHGGSGLKDGRYSPCVTAGGLIFPPF